MQNRRVFRWLAVGGSAALMVLMLSAATGCGANAASAATSPASAGASGSVVHENLKIINGTGTGAHPDWPAYVPANWSVKAGETVLLTITSNDDGTAPLPGGSPYAKVQGTVDGSELVNGHAIQSLANKLVAHTFTVPSLGVNLVIPAAPKGGTVTVQATIHFTKAGTYTWRCEAPCGSGTSGWAGPMVMPGYMQGTLTVQA